MGYLKDALRGVGWMTTFRVLYRVIGFARIAILARLLTPFSLGVYGIVTIVLGFLEIITETGINVFLIQDSARYCHFPSYFCFGRIGFKIL
jgi:O-antigen/teichoic acid export membrane protein